MSAGKTRFALVKLLEWVGNPERCLYLIDTTNGELRIQENIVKEAAKEAIERQTYAFYDYNTKLTWGEDQSVGRMPVMTYAGFGAEVRKNQGKFHWLDYDYIICDEMHNLVDYQRFNDRSTNLEVAESALRTIAAERETKIVAMSATPEKIRKRFGELCYDVRFDRSDLQQLCTSSSIAYSCKVEELLETNKGKTGILYVTEIDRMKHYIEYANSIGYHAEGFWSISLDTQKKKPMTAEQFKLRETVLKYETIPEEYDLLVINRASETCIKIKEEHRKVDFMIVHDKNDEVKTQVRARYHGDLPVFYYHDIEAANTFTAKHIELPERFLNVRLYSDQWNELCQFVGLKRPHGGFYSMPTTAKYLGENGYCVVKKKDSKKNGQYYYVISARDTNLGKLI